MSQLWADLQQTTDRICLWLSSVQPRDKADAAVSDLINMLRDTLGVELSIDKCAPLASSQVFLGLEANTVDMSISVPTDKFNKASCYIPENWFPYNWRF